jgi:DNA-binding NtrC family response regulator
MYIKCMDRLKLSETEKTFFRMVSQAAFLNPFGEERFDLDLKIAAPKGGSPEQTLEAVIARVAGAVNGLEGSGRADIRYYDKADRELVETIFLFDVFHRFIDEFDKVIQKQAGSSEHVSPVPFARDLLAILMRRGFSMERSHKLFAIFYQMRRAFFFINNGLTGRSPSMRRLRMHLWNNIFTHDIQWYEKYLWNRMEDFSTLLLGETGTGKGAAAAAIGRSGFIPYDDKNECFTESFMRNFIPINLSQFPESLIESELFGHKKGAFTGAIENHEGVFSRCTPHGAIFLDEVGDVSIPVQIKLLQILQERVFSPVGSHARLRFNGRVIAATNKPLDELRDRGQFRDDFFYRLCSDIITVPPLRQRLQEDPEELDGLIAHLLNRMIGEAVKEAALLVREVIDKNIGKDYPWPGNVRELEQAVRRILIMRRYREDTKTPPHGLMEKIATGIESGTLDAETLLADYCLLLYKRYGSYEEVARRTKLDRRTAKRYIQMMRP